MRWRRHAGRAGVDAARRTRRDRRLPRAPGLGRRSDGATRPPARGRRSTGPMADRRRPRRRRHGCGLSCRARRRRIRPRGRHQARPRRVGGAPCSLRRRAPDPRRPRPPRDRAAPRRRHHSRRPSLLRPRAGRRCADRPVVRRAGGPAARSPRHLRRGVRGGVVRASATRAPPRHQALEHPGHASGRAEAPRLRDREAPRPRDRRRARDDH